MRYLKPNNLYCFSPPVMLATFIIEIALAVYTLFQYRSEKVAKLSIAILVLLALFQLAEFNVCSTAFGLDSLTWSRLGYVWITFLPVLGVHALLAIAKKNAPLLVAGLYSVATVFALYFLGVGHGLTASVCTGNYVIFEVNPNINTLYMLYYYGLEVFAVYLTLSLAGKIKQRKTRRALYGMTVGYLCLLIPTTTVNVLNPETVRGIPSIMCGFAVLLALLIAFVVLPNSASPRHKNSLMTRLFQR